MWNTRSEKGTPVFSHLQPTHQHSLTRNFNRNQRTNTKFDMSCGVCTVTRAVGEVREKNSEKGEFLYCTCDYTTAPRLYPTLTSMGITSSVFMTCLSQRSCTRASHGLFSDRFYPRTQFCKTRGSLLTTYSAGGWDAKGTLYTATGKESLRGGGAIRVVRTLHPAVG